MKIAVIAAGGRSGQVFVTAALAAGHQVTAGIHTDNPFIDSANLRVMQCDATDTVQLRTLLAGQDAVVSLIGHVKGSPAMVQTDATTAILSVMTELGIVRFVSLTGTGVRFSGDRVTYIDRFLNFGITLVDPKRISDGKEHVEMLKKSNSQWTILRVLKLENIHERPYRLTEHGPTRIIVGRVEVASAILQVLDRHSFIQKAPIISPVK